MSTYAVDLDQYKFTVYVNLFVGIVFGERRELAVATPVSQLLTVLFDSGVYTVLYVTSVHILL